MADPVQAPGEISPAVVGRPSPVFEPKQPDQKYSPLPYRTDTIVDGWSNDTLTIRAASIRGLMHRYDGTPRQDDFAISYDHARDRLFVAVADGVSAADQSHIGSTTAVRFVTNWLAQNCPDSLDEIDWTELARFAAWALVEATAKFTGSEPDAAEAERLMATTLTGAVVEAAADTGLRAQVASIGDSGAWLVDESGFTSVIGTKDTGGALTTSAVSGLPRLPESVETTNVEIPPGAALLLATDGFGDPLGSGTGAVGELFSTTLLGDRPSMIQFIHALDFSRETFDDDRTLVAVWPEDDPEDS